MLEGREEATTRDHLGDEVSSKSSRQARSRIDLDDEARVFALGLIENWVKDPSNVRLLRIGLDLWPAADVLERIRSSSVNMWSRAGDEKHRAGSLGIVLPKYSGLGPPKQVSSRITNASRTASISAPIGLLPYTEGLTLAEANHELAFLATGIYGKSLLNQNGAPIRLVVPWKYGFKGAKSLARTDFVSDQPKTLWNQRAPNEYGFYANVNPEVGSSPLEPEDRARHRWRFFVRQAVGRS